MSLIVSACVDSLRMYPAVGTTSIIVISQVLLCCDYATWEKMTGGVAANCTMAEGSIAVCVLVADRTVMNIDIFSYMAVSILYLYRVSYIV